MRFYNTSNKSFHPKAYIFHNNEENEIYIGSSNLSKSALTTAIEWNYHFTRNDNPNDFDTFKNNFNNLFDNHSVEVTDDILANYSKNYKKPKFISETNELFKPNSVQIEALYALKNTREEGFDKALVVAATGTGKTYLAAFDSLKYKKILFVAHRQEILKQAEKTFKNIHKDKSTGFFYGEKKDLNTDITFALIQTLGKTTYLNEKYFKRDYFDYIIIDEFHHAVSNNYKNLLDYFRSEFLLGLTATPERMDNKDIYALCDYNNVYEIKLKQAINKGFLSPFRYYGIYDDPIDYDYVKMKNNKYDDKDLEEKLMINKRANLILSHYLKYNFKKTLAFCSSKNHAEYMAEFFTNHNIASASLYSGEKNTYLLKRGKAIEKLENGELKILFVVDMFNEGVDIPSIDSVLFLRPTQSQTVFLQQLGRGLRKSKNKKFLTVLDFIGNYKKANMTPFLLSDADYNTKTLLNDSVLDFEYPDDCFIDFDFKLIDLFKIQAKNELKLKNKINIEYENIKNELNQRPNRTDMFLKMDSFVLNSMKPNRKLNLLKDYLTFLKDHNELTKEEDNYFDSVAHDFLKTLENTSMTKSYKIPILLAFYNNGNIKMEISDDVYHSMKEFYEVKSNGADILKDKSSKDYQTWSKKKYVKLAMKNPIKYLNKTHGEFFIKKDNCALSLRDDLKKYITLETFKNHFKDIIEYRTIEYYRNRSLK